MKITYDDLEMAFELSSADDLYGEDMVYLCTESGKIYYDSDLIDEPVPDDLYENSKYIIFPNKHDLDLGRNLVMKFVLEYLTEDYETVYSIFRSKGAYSRYKSFLDKRRSLDNWRKFEEAAQKEQLLDWCDQNGIEVDV